MFTAIKSYLLGHPGRRHCFGKKRQIISPVSSLSEQAINRGKQRFLPQRGQRCSACGTDAGSGLTRTANAALVANCKIRVDSEDHRKRVQNPVAFPSKFLENNALAGSGGSGSLSFSRDKVSTGEMRDSSGSTSSSK